MNSNRLKQFMAVYQNELLNAMREYPHEYHITEQQVPIIASKMKKAFRDRTYNKDGRAIVATCRKLGIRHTYTNMEKYFNGE